MEPPRISVIDLAAAITKKDASQAAEQVAYVKERHPEVTEIFGDFKFRGQGQKKTPVADLRGAVELTQLRCDKHVNRTINVTFRFKVFDFYLKFDRCENSGSFVATKPVTLRKKQRARRRDSVFWYS